jgi:predicted N-formylglutamate amidohydrolase
MALDSAGRLREEDPFTGMLVAGLPNRVVCNISRFCVDLNRSLDKAVYLKPADAWNLKVWNQPLGAEELVRLQRMHDEYYLVLGALLKGLERHYGRFVVLDVHSYNYRRAGPDGAPMLQEQAPDINIGTFSMDRKRWAPVVDCFIEFCAAHSIQGRPLDVRENIAFEGRGEQTRFIHQQFPETGCAIAVEFKKIFMDEWTGVPDNACIQHLQALLTAAVPILEQVLDARS